MSAHTENRTLAKNSALQLMEINSRFGSRHAKGLFCSLTMQANKYVLTLPNAKYVLCVCVCVFGADTEANAGHAVCGLRVSAPYRSGG